jgi:hypothetical protein
MCISCSRRQEENKVKGILLDFIVITKEKQLQLVSLFVGLVRVAFFRWSLDVIPEQVFPPSEAFGGKWELPPGVANIVSGGTEDRGCRITV